MEVQFRAAGLVDGNFPPTGDIKEKRTLLPACWKMWRQRDGVKAAGSEMTALVPVIRTAAQRTGLPVMAITAGGARADQWHGWGSVQRQAAFKQGLEDDVQFGALVAQRRFRQFQPKLERAAGDVPRHHRDDAAARRRGPKRDGNPPYRERERGNRLRESICVSCARMASALRAFSRGESLSERKSRLSRALG